MANYDAPFGARPISNTSSSYIGQVNKYYIPSTDSVITAVGDLVKSAGSADADGIATVTRAAAGDAVRGIVTGFEFPNRNYENLPNYRPASVACYAYVMDDPMGMIVMQEDSVGNNLAATDVGLNVNFIVANANSSTGQSQMEIDSSTALDTATLPLKILGLYPVANNAIGANAQWVLSFNTHELKALTGSTGV